jgi:hypothetical protein
MTMISSYRLGDLVLLELGENEQNELLSDYPYSIGGKYILRKRNRDTRDNIDIVTEIALGHLKQHEHLLPKDIAHSTVIHLRLGDVIAGNEWHERLKRPISKHDIKALIGDDMNKKYVIGKCFFAKTSSTNYQDCVTYSNIYLQNVLTELGAQHFDSGNADIDLCCALKAKVFLQGRGFFSKLIVEIRKRLNLHTIETSVHD